MKSITLSTVTAALLLSSAAAQADVVISSKPTQNMSCNAGVCTATAHKAVLNVGDLQAMLASGDTTVKTGSVTKDIDISVPVTWSSTSRLTLDAQQSIVMNRPVTVTGTGSLTVTTNDGGKNGDLFFLDKGAASFWDPESKLTIDGRQLNLVTSLSELGRKIDRDPSGLYALAASYDAKGEVYDQVPVKTSFAGIFEGLGNSVSNVKIRHKVGGAAGVFAVTTRAAIVRDISLRQVHVLARPGEPDVGALVGYSDGAIINAHVEGRIDMVLGLGGLTGGIAGTLSESARMSRSSASVKITSVGYTGGLVGYNSGDIESSFATGSVEGESPQFYGGLVGWNSGHIANSYADVQVTVGDSVGGLVGHQDSFAGIDHDYSVGMVAWGAATGGLVGRDTSGGTIDSYWDLDTSGITDPGQGAGDPYNDSGITGLTDAELRSGLPTGFDPKIWGQSPSINNGYPYLLANPPPK